MRLVGDSGLKRRMKRTCSLAAFVSVSLAIGWVGPSQSQAGRFKSPEGYWYFGGATHIGKASEIGTNSDKGNASDPLNIMFYGKLHDNIMSRAWIALEAAPYTEFGVLPGWGDSKQSLLFNDGNWPHATTKWITQDGAFGTAPSTVSRWHFRVWEDKHKTEMVGGFSNAWTVAGVHHDKATPRNPIVLKPLGFRLPLNHKVDRPWDQGRLFAIGQFGSSDGAAYCTYRKWRRHKGAEGMFQGIYSSGILGRISTSPIEWTCKGA